MPQIPCRDCREPIEPDAKKCPHCSTKQWTKSRSLEYAIFWVPLTALIIGPIFYFMIDGTNPVINIWFLPITIIVLWVLGAAMTYGEYSKHRGRVQDAAE